MAGNFYYSPGVQDRRGEILGMGIARAGEALAAGIEEAKRKQKERTAYASLAETLGLDPKKVSKEQVQAALLKDQIMQARAERAQQIRSRSAMQNFFQGLLNQRQAPAPATSADRAAAGLLGVNPDEQAAGAPAAMPAGQAAVLRGLQSNPEMLDAPGGAQFGQDIIKSLLTPAKTPTFGTTPGGRFMAIEPTGGVRFEPNPPAGGAGRQPLTEQERQAWPEIDRNTEAWENERTLSGHVIPGHYISVDRKTKKATGKVAFDPQNAPRTGTSSVDELNNQLAVKTDLNKPLDLPEDTDGLVDGQLYNTSRGQARWNADKMTFTQ